MAAEGAEVAVLDRDHAAASDMAKKIGKTALAIACDVTKPDEVKRVIRAGIKANRYMRENREGTIPILMSTYRIDREVASAAYDSFIKGFNNDGSMPEDGFRRLLDDTKRLMKIDREVAFSEVSDLSILREVQRELGIK